MKPNLVWFDIPATDLARAMRFYSAVLGRELKEENFGGVSTAMLPTADGGQQGCVVVVKDFKPSADGIMIYFDVNGRLKEAVAAVRANGGTVQTDVHSIGSMGFARRCWIRRGTASLCMRRRRLDSERAFQHFVT